MAFTSYPYLIKTLIAVTNASLAFLIYAAFLALGLCLNSFIISIGSANNPTPPNKTKNTHPKNDKIAIT